MPATIDLTEAQVFQALRVNFLQLVLPSTVEIVRGLVNRVPSPSSADYVVLTPLQRVRLETNTETWDQTNPDPVSINALTPFQATVQMDVHGPNSAENATIIAAAFRSSYACTQFTASGFAVQPLYCEDPRQIPFDTGAQQVEERWVIDAHLQINPNVTLTQDFANQLAIGLVDVDARYPP